jgi:hypothetical protein
LSMIRGGTAAVACGAGNPIMHFFCYKGKKAQQSD